MDYQQALAQSNQGLNTAVSTEKEDSQEKTTQTQENQTEPILSDWQNRFQISTNRVSLRKSSGDILSDIREQCIKYIYDLLFSGRKKSVFDNWSQEISSNIDQTGQNQTQGTQTQGKTSQGNGATDMIANTNGSTYSVSIGNTNSSTNSNSNTNTNSNTNGNMILGSNLKVLKYQQMSWQKETEQTAFSTTGTVKTADGREISFNMDIGMSREFQQYYEEDITLAQFQMCDPLVINLDTNIAGLSDQKFYFDIDADGEMDEISQLKSGSGYLALDKNGDGTINDGNELFGTSSGNGFADLAKYDEDGNGWIDENDSVWNQLKIWCKDENGKDVLYRLADKGVGAICLKNTSTDFTLKGETSGQTNGAIRNTGIFLYENGNVGTVQHVDVTKFNQNA